MDAVTAKIGLQSDPAALPDVRRIRHAVGAAANNAGIAQAVFQIGGEVGFAQHHVRQSFAGRYVKTVDCRAKGQDFQRDS